MTRLTGYLVRLFTLEALSFFLVAAFLVWITQTLRLFDVVTAKGQDMLTLLGQSTLTTPPLARAIIYICMAVGMARALRALQDSGELHTIHSTRRTSALWAAVSAFIFCGVFAVSLVANWIEPLSKRAYANWSEEVAADLIGRALHPHRFSEVTPGLVVVIGGRAPDGSVIDFFADDTREPETRRTYIAKKAIIQFDGDGYNISLVDGAVQYVRSGDQFTEIAFSRYELGLSQLTQPGGSNVSIDHTDTIDLIRNGLASGGISDAAWYEISERMAEMLRVAAICMLVAAFSGYPHARRGRDYIPIEVTVLIVGLGDRALGAAVANQLPTGQNTGALIMLVVALVIITKKQFGFQLPKLPKAVS